VAFPPTRLTVAQFASEWLATAKPSLRERTWVRYRELIVGHVLPTYGTLHLARLQAADLNALYRAKLASGLGASSVHRLHTVVHTMLEQATRLDLVTRNVARLATPPREVSHEMQFLRPDQAQRLLDAAVGDRLEALYVLAVTAGVRQGELLGLRWKDVDVDRGTVAVTGSAQRLAAASRSRSRRRLAPGAR